jgi:hypothetical protein
VEEEEGTSEICRLFAATLQVPPQRCVTSVPSTLTVLADSLLSPPLFLSLSPPPLSSGCLCSCGLLGITFTQQVPLLEQKREKEEEVGCQSQ